MSHAHHGVAQEARAGILAVRLDTEARHEVADRADDALGLFVLDETAVGGDDAVRSGRVHAAEDLAARLLGALAVAAAARVAPLPRPSVRGALQLAAGRVGGHHLVAIAVRLIHAQDGPQRGRVGHVGEQLGHTRVLACELLRVRNAHVLAGAALALDGTDGRFLRGTLRGLGATRRGTWHCRCSNVRRE